MHCQAAFPINYFFLTWLEKGSSISTKSHMADIRNYVFNSDGVVAYSDLCYVPLLSCGPCKIHIFMLNFSYIATLCYYDEFCRLHYINLMFSNQKIKWLPHKLIKTTV